MFLTRRVRREVAASTKVDSLRNALWVECTVVRTEVYAYTTELCARDKTIGSACRMESRLQAEVRSEGCCTINKITANASVVKSFNPTIKIRIAARCLGIDSMEMSIMDDQIGFVGMRLEPICT
jgi:hypothetical protein